MHPPTLTSSKPNISRHLGTLKSLDYRNSGLKKASKQLTCSQLLCLSPSPQDHSLTHEGLMHTLRLWPVVVTPLGCFQLALYILNMCNFCTFFSSFWRTPQLYGRPARVPASDTQRQHHTRWGVTAELRQTWSRLGSRLRNRSGTSLLLQSSHQQSFIFTLL